MAQNFGSPITDKTKDAREALRVALGLGTDVPFSDYINHIPSQWTPAEIFKAGQKGFWYEPDDISTLSQDAAGLVPVTSNNDPIGRVKDKSGNGFDAVQSISARRMLYKISPPRFFSDYVDDEFVINIPTSDLIGEIIIATSVGTAIYKTSLPAGQYLLNGKILPRSEIVGVLFREGGFTDSETLSITKYFVSKGAVESYINTVSFASMWQDSILTEFPLIDMSNAEDLIYAWRSSYLLTSFPHIDIPRAKNLTWSWAFCRKLTSFPPIDMSKVTNFISTWYGCSDLTSFPFVDVSSGNSFSGAWNGCSKLENFPVNMFNNIKGGDFFNAFANTNLSQESIDGILVSLVASGIASGTRRFNQTGGSAPSAIGKKAIDTLRSRGWTVSVTGGY